MGNLLPNWFKGELFAEGAIATNPDSGESFELNAEELSMYPFIVKLENTPISKNNVDKLTNALI